MNLTPAQTEALRIAVAETTGDWEFKPNQNQNQNYVCVYLNGQPKMRFYPEQPDEIYPRLNMAGVPRFTTSVDAIRAEVMKLPQSEQGDLASAFHHVLVLQNVSFWKLTATDWAIAFLRVKNPSKLQTILATP